MKDVAARAGVSLGTVSNVLNRPGVVSAATRERVEFAIAALGFVRNESARHLRSGRSRTLAYVVLDAANPFFTDVAAGVQSSAEQAGLATYLCNCGDDPARQARYLELLAEQRVQGVLVTPVDAADPRLDQLPRQGTPVVVVDRWAGPGHCSVTVDDVAGGAMAAGHLLETGHERIAVVGGPVALGQVSDRIAGARSALEGAGRDPDELVVLETRSLTIAEGRRAGERLAGLPARRRPTGVFCANDLLALGLLQRTMDLGLRCPDQLAIVGYDDIEFAAAAAVPLTSVAQPRERLGSTAVQLLVDEASAGAEHEHRQVVFTPELVVRSSTLARGRTASA